jgi:hypothetical protein
MERVVDSFTTISSVKVENKIKEIKEIWHPISFAKYLLK